MKARNLVGGLLVAGIGFIFVFSSLSSSGHKIITLHLLPESIYDSAYTLLPPFLLGPIGWVMVFLGFRKAIWTKMNRKQLLISIILLGFLIWFWAEVFGHYVPSISTGFNKFQPQLAATGLQEDGDGMFTFIQGTGHEITVKDVEFVIANIEYPVGRKWGRYFGIATRSPSVRCSASQINMWGEGNAGVMKNNTKFTVLVGGCSPPGAEVEKLYIADITIRYVHQEDGSQHTETGTIEWRYEGKRLYT